MGLSQGSDIEQITGTKKVGSKGTAEKLPHYDKRGAPPLKNPQKLHFLHPEEGAHGLCLRTGFAGALVGGVSSSKNHMPSVVFGAQSQPVSLQERVSDAP